MKKENKILVLVCDCGKTLEKHIDFHRLFTDLAGGGHKVIFHKTEKFCEAKDCRRILLKILKGKPAGLVIAACERERYAAGMADVFKKARFNEGLMASVNLREHCAWVHSNRREATDKAVRLLASAVARVRQQEPIKTCVRMMCPKVTVLGGGMAGIQTALRLAELGRHVNLIHRAPQLGGTAAMMAPFFGYLDCDSRQGAREMKAVLDDSVSRALNAKNIKVLSDAEVLSVEGSSGNFFVNVLSGKERKSIEAGAIVLAVGSFSAFPFETVGISPLPKIIDLLGLASRLARSGSMPDKIAILMDIANEQTRAVNALALGAAELLVRQYKKEVKIYCHHIRVAATGLEDLYRRARSAGVVVVRSDKLPVISVSEDGVVLKDGDGVAGQPESFDLAVIADSLPDDAVKGMARKAQIGSGPEAWLQYDNVWLLPTLSTRPGIYVVGAARGNNDFREAMNDASGAAAAIDALLSSGRIVMAEDQAQVDTDKCVLCLTCVRSCPHSAAAFNPASAGDELKPHITVSESACRRCGICATLCPAQAIQLPRFMDSQTEAELEQIGKVVVFACQNSAWRAASAAGINRRPYGSDVQVIPVPCAGKADSRLILRALEKGAAKVILLGCHRESCRYLTGADYAAKRIQYLRTKIEQAGHKAESLVVGNLTEFESERFLEYVYQAK